VVPAAAACAANVRRVPLGHALWLAGFAVLAILARRNVALAGPVCGYLLALHGAAFLRRLARTPAASRLPRLPVGLNLAAILLAAIGVAAWATEWPLRVRHLRRRFGPGLYRPNYPVDIARRLGELDAPGDIFCENWGDAGTFIYHSRPRRVWMDGRLEAHSFERFQEQRRIEQALRTARGAGTVRLPETLRFFFVRAMSRDPLTALSASPRFRLLFVDRVGACFARTDWRPRPAAGPIAPLPARPNLADFDRPMREGWRIEGVVSEPRRWWRQNPPPVHYPLGAMFLWLGWQRPTAVLDPADRQRQRCTLLSIRYLTAALADGLVDRRIVTGMLAQAHQQRALQEPVTCSPAVPLDYHSARALYLYGQLDLADLADENLRRFAEQHVDALIRARQLDAAERAAAAILKNAPADLPARQREIYRTLHSRIAGQVRLSRQRAAALRLPAPRRARALTAPDVGLIELAVAELRAAAPTAGNRLLLGDLLLNRGRPDEASQAYAEAALRGVDPPTARSRQSLCRRVAGLVGAKRLPKGFFTPMVRYYHALVWEQLGYYDSALVELRGTQAEDEQLGRLIDRLRRRLILR